MLEIEDLEVTYSTRQSTVRAVEELSLEIQPGEILGIVGESGCGKSTLASAIPALLEENGRISHGSIRYKGRELTSLSEQVMRNEIRGREISMIFQDASTSLDPVFTVGKQLIETIREHLDLSKTEAKQHAIDVLESVGIPSAADRLDDYPHQFSGGMQQRAVIAIALACNPDLIIADEPTTGLDVSIQSQILSLLSRINMEYGTTIIMISHDLGVVAEICERVGVMYAGNIIETAPINDLFKAPKHPYTRDLLQSIPESHGTKEALTVIEGAPPDLRNPPTGCRYHPRCTDICCDACETGDIPPNYSAGASQVRCYLHDPAENADFPPALQEPDK